MPSDADKRMQLPIRTRSSHASYQCNKTRCTFTAETMLLFVTKRTNISHSTLNKCVCIKFDLITKTLNNKREECRRHTTQIISFVSEVAPLHNLHEQIIWSSSLRCRNQVAVTIITSKKGSRCQSICDRSMFQPIRTALGTLSILNPYSNGICWTFQSGIPAVIS